MLVEPQTSTASIAMVAVAAPVTIRKRAEGTSEASMTPGRPRRATAANTRRRGSGDVAVRVSLSHRGLSDQLGATEDRVRIMRPRRGA
jgi:hypothetical protein